MHIRSALTGSVLTLAALALYACTEGPTGPEGPSGDPGPGSRVVVSQDFPDAPHDAVRFPDGMGTFSDPPLFQCLVTDDDGETWEPAPFCLLRRSESGPYIHVSDGNGGDASAYRVIFVY
ncbi:MAG: hypothetical protein ACODAB_10130 [Gemmatimonadota bacterium]